MLKLLKFFFIVVFLTPLNVFSYHEDSYSDYRGKFIKDIHSLSESEYISLLKGFKNGDYAIISGMNEYEFFTDKECDLNTIQKIDFEEIPVFPTISIMFINKKESDGGLYMFNELQIVNPNLSDEFIIESLNKNKFIEINNLILEKEKYFYKHFYESGDTIDKVISKSMVISNIHLNEKSDQEPFIFIQPLENWNLFELYPNQINVEKGEGLFVSRGTVKRNPYSEDLHIILKKQKIPVISIGNNNCKDDKDLFPTGYCPSTSYKPYSICPINETLNYIDYLNENPIKLTREKIDIKNIDLNSLSNETLEAMNTKDLIDIINSTKQPKITVQDFENATVTSFECKNDYGDNNEFYILDSDLTDTHLTTNFSGGFYGSGSKTLNFFETKFNNQFIYNGEDLLTTFSFDESNDLYQFKLTQPINSNFLYDYKGYYYVSRYGEGYRFSPDALDINYLNFYGTCKKINNPGKRFYNIWNNFKKDMIDQSLKIIPSSKAIF